MTTTQLAPQFDPAAIEKAIYQRWMDASVSDLRLTYRDYGKKPRPDVGFRIARYVE